MPGPILDGGEQKQGWSLFSRVESAGGRDPGRRGVVVVVIQTVCSLAEGNGEEFRKK